MRGRARDDGVTTAEDTGYVSPVLTRSCCAAQATFSGFDKHEGLNPVARVTPMLRRSPQSYAARLQVHLDDYQPLFRRVVTGPRFKVDTLTSHRPVHPANFRRTTIPRW